MAILIEKTNKQLSSYHDGIALYSSLNYVDGDKGSGRIIGKGKFDYNVFGGVSNVKGNRGRYITFDGSVGTYANILNSGPAGLLTDLANLKDFTLAVNFKLNSFANIQYLFSVRDHTNVANNFFDVRLDHTAQRLGLVIFDGLGNDTGVFHTLTLSQITEYWLKIVRENGLWFIGIDDEPLEGGIKFDDPNDSSKILYRANTTTNFNLATSRNDGSAGNSQVSLGHLVLWTRALSQTERSQYDLSNSLLV